MKIKTTVVFEWESRPEYWSDTPNLTTEQYADIIHKHIEDDPSFMMDEPFTVLEVVVE